MCKEQNDRHTTMHTYAACSIWSERENHDVTTTETHPTPSGWHNSALFAGWCVPVCMEAVFQIISCGPGQSTCGGDSCRGRPQVLDSGQKAHCQTRPATQRHCS